MYRPWAASWGSGPSHGRSPRRCLGAARLPAVGGTGSGRLPAACRPLDACRHHGKEDRWHRRRSAALGCAQRLSASRQGGQTRGDASESARPVLNACRHHGKEDMRSVLMVAMRHLVLNACRHHGKEDPSPEGASKQETRAQRLSASRQGGRPRSRKVAGPREECSTPVGITARRTGGESAPRQPAGVLNACRHHGKEDSQSTDSSP